MLHSRTNIQKKFLNRINTYIVSCLTVLTLKLCFILIGQCFVFLCLLSYLEELLFDLGGLVGVRVFESVEFCLEILSLLFQLVYFLFVFFLEI